MTSFNWTIDIMAVLVIIAALCVVFISLPLTVRLASKQCYIAMARAVEAREPYLVGHSELTAKYVVLMAWVSMRLSPNAINKLQKSALLHTMGKVGVSFGLLNSAEPLITTEDFIVAREYVRIGAAMLTAVPELSGSSDAVLYHKEYLDGSGYPYGKSGDEIPFSARLLCVASEFVAMTNPRIYRNQSAMTANEAIRHFEHFSASRYDPVCVQALKTVHWLLNQRFVPLKWRTIENDLDSANAPFRLKA